MEVVTGFAVTFPVSLFVALAGSVYAWDWTAPSYRGLIALSLVLGPVSIGIAWRWGRCAPLVGVVCGALAAVASVVGRGGDARRLTRHALTSLG